MSIGDGQPGTEKPAMKLSGHASMVITAFCFMVLMLIVTAPAAGPGTGPVMDQGPQPVQNNMTVPVASPPTALLMAGSGQAPDRVMERVQIISGL